MSVFGFKENKCKSEVLPLRILSSTTEGLWFGSDSRYTIVDIPLPPGVDGNKLFIIGVRAKVRYATYSDPIDEIITNCGSQKKVFDIQAIYDDSTKMVRVTIYCDETEYPMYHLDYSYRVPIQVLYDEIPFNES